MRCCDVDRIAGQILGDVIPIFSIFQSFNRLDEQGDLIARARQIGPAFFEQVDPLRVHRPQVRRQGGPASVADDGRQLCQKAAG